MCLGRTDLPLGEEGLRQAEEMAKRLPPVTALYSSPLRRAVQTAQAVGQEIRILEGLQEFYAGEWDGLTFEEIRIRYPELYAARGKDLSIPLPGAEDTAEGLARFNRAMETAAQESPGDFAAVAHGGVLAHFVKQFTDDFEKPGYAQIIPMVWEAGRFRIQED